MSSATKAPVAEGPGRNAPCWDPSRYDRGECSFPACACKPPQTHIPHDEMSPEGQDALRALVRAAQTTTAPTPTDRGGEDVLAHWAKQIAFYTDGIGGAATPTVTLLRDLAENLTCRKIIENREGWARGLHSRADLLEEAAREIRKALASAPAPSDPAGAGGDLDWLLRQVIELCEDTETKMDEALSKGPTNEQEVGFYRGRAYEAKGVRRAIAEVARLREEDRSGKPVTSTPGQKGAGGDLGELERKIDAAAEAILSRRGFGYYTDPMEGGQDAYDISLEAREEATAALKAAGQLVASTPGQKGAGEEKTGASFGPGSRKPGPSVPASGFDPSRKWRPIWEAPKGRDENGILQQVLLIGSYPSNGHHTDIVESWWCPVGSADVDGYWERWRHAFPPSHWMPVPAPPRVRDRSSEAAETSGSAEGKSPADLSATPAQTPPPSATPEGDPPMTVEEARDLLDREASGGRTPWAQIKWLKMLAAQYAATTTEQRAFLYRAARIEVALNALAPSESPSTKEASDA